ncbi:MAG: hypothetical protein ABS69_00880 [Nitrosomonadales bacterium SCN 54-20]|nr:MAG: hypothetical protein ABS69_00880 [Nitrosomonadales bacterium SCN 54-20]
MRLFYFGRGAALKEYVYQWWIGLDQWINTWFGGSADETISSRCWRTRFIPSVNIARIVIDALFLPFQGPHHCENAYIKDVMGRHLPYRFYDEAIRMNLEFDRNKLGDQVEMPK